MRWEAEGWESTCRAHRRSQSSPMPQTGECVTLTAAQTNECYRRCGVYVLERHLLPHQRKEKKYKVTRSRTGRVQLSSQQRSLVDLLLRKNLGSGTSCHLYLETCRSTSLRRIAEFRCAVHGKLLDVTQETLESNLHDGLRWWTSLINSTIMYERTPAVIFRRKLSQSDRKHVQRSSKRCMQQKRLPTKEIWG